MSGSRSVPDTVAGPWPARMLRARRLALRSTRGGGAPSATEIALLAGVDPAHYARLEAGAPPSPSALRPVLRVLGLDPAEVAAVETRLAARPGGRPRSARPGRPGPLLTDTVGVPFLVVTPALRVVRANPAGTELLRRLTGRARPVPLSWAHYVLCADAARARLPRWAGEAAVVVARLRRAAGHGDPDAVALAGRLWSRRADVRRLWAAGAPDGADLLLDLDGELRRYQRTRLPSGVLLLPRTDPSLRKEEP
ncbi:MmyB family transcriptional regulator [Jiangella endophytica]|uniref:MmyB family transcriptional regulator n=1 Tax=Jiangella endophytica TaxID=1623398 RepID=UPI001300509E|nr:helix-turn-helix domain-containing protein [Jiangella endophytica]